MSPDMKLFGYSLKCALNFILSSVKVLGDKYGNAVSLKFIFNTIWCICAVVILMIKS